MSVDYPEWPWPSAPDSVAEYPSPDDLMARWTGVVDASIGALQDIPEEAFNRPGKLSDEILAEACMRVINHQNAHLRQIWFILDRGPLAETGDLARVERLPKVCA